jgi:putative SOS response-associated peptidase YedK
MCGRFTLTTPPDRVRDVFGLDATPELEPRFNLAPGQELANVTQDPEAGRVLRARRWGLVPRWAKDAKLGARLINARAETAAEKPAYRDAFRRRRCLVPADGFFEWSGSGRSPRQPWYISRPDAACFAIAGLHERWRRPEGDWLETCVLLTTDGSPQLAAIHDRMPLILDSGEWSLWLDPEIDDPATLAGLLHRFAAPSFALRKVGPHVNRTEHDDPRCIAAAEPDQPELFG